ncbi:outer membrane protein assembly factor BamD [Sphingomonas corticis]|jgi:TolA-binding protein|uniref:Outer membrane protein assembly factor BamD n=1 Tax=Sphingomonas corticis TaxID=2722791 RepID=A0ABX1CRK7_9SPHN|nr:outer membrane protein assembly factor BamD [Sphingomonas corticis]NJR79012.1 outer membrane protein assembly factor BamD [Sphingomonas corticis]
MTKWMLAAGAAMVLALPAAAQSGLEGRVGKLESEMRAVQRKVFPGGAGATVAPEIAPVVTPATPDGTPATTPIADLTGRVASLEQQIAGMTGQIEQAQYRLRQLEEQFTAYRTATDAKLASGAAPVAAAEPSVTVPVAPRPAGASEPAAAPETASGLTAGGEGIVKPSTGDAAEDEYTYGYRLWAAKRYADAATQLKKVATTYPKHRRATFAQNLLGRTYLDDNKPSLASIAFYENYKKYPDGERAPESLYYLGSALLKLDKPADACKVYGELLDVYGDKITPAMKTSVGRARTSAKCS